MTLSFPVERRPGAATTPQALPTTGSLQPEPYHLQFLSAEERSSAVLQGFFRDARVELETFIRSGDLTPADGIFYRQLLDEVDRIGSTLNAEGAKWVSSTIPDAFSAGWRLSSSTVVPQAALEALSRETMSLIVDTSRQQREIIRQSIAQGILQGLSGADVRARLLAGGLTNIPHWPSVEYRAGVIARTETMRAFNGGVLQAIEETGALFARWIVSPDEAVCRICGPRSGIVYRLSAGQDIVVSAYPSAIPLPKLPAHPRCRCTIRAEYRSQDGMIIRPGTADVAPALPVDAMGGRLPPKMPYAVGDLDSAIEGLGRVVDMSLDELNAMQTFWQGVDLRGLSSSQPIYMRLARLPESSFRSFFEARYSVSVTGLGRTLTEQRAWLVESMEMFEKAGFRWRGQSSLKAFNFVDELPGGAPNPAHYRPLHSEVNMVPSRYLGTERTPYRIGNLPYMQSSMVHELGHALDAYLSSAFGSVGGGSIRSIYFAADKAKIVRDLNNALDAVDDVKTTIYYLEQSGGTAARIEYQKELLARYQRSADTLQKMLDDAASLGDVGSQVTDYAKESEFEDFADSLVAYLLDPERLRTTSPARWEWFVKNVGELV